MDSEPGIRQVNFIYSSRQISYGQGNLTVTRVFGSDPDSRVTVKAQLKSIEMSIRAPAYGFEFEKIEGPAMCRGLCLSSGYSSSIQFYGRFILET